MSESPTYVRRPLYRRSDAEIAAERPGADIAGYGLALVVAAVVFLIAFDRASYGEVSRTSLAIGVWWAVILAVVLGLRSVLRLPRAALIAAGLLLAFAVWTLASTQWAASAERAFTEFDRVMLYLGVFLLVLIVSPRSSASRWADGIAIGIAVIGLLALASRLFPDTISTNDFETVLTSAYARLSYPLGYWNGLAIFCAMGFPLLLRAAVASRYALLRGLALAPLPALLAVIYLASSRGGFATAIFGTFCFLLLTRRRLSAIAAALIGGVAAIGAVAVLEARTELVNNPALPVAESQGRSAALLIGALCLLAGVIWAAATALLNGRLSPSVTLERAGAVAVLIAAAVGIAMAQPVERFEQFKALPADVTPTGGDPVTSHLLSKSGTGRWQLWTAAVDEFEAEPLRGEGAGSFAAAWLRSPLNLGFARDAHSLYAETLGELGIIGFPLLAGTFLVGILSGLRRTLAGREAAAAVLAAFLAYALGAAIDWIWELTAVTVVAVVLLALMTGPATLGAPGRREGRSPPSRRMALAAGAAIAVLGLVAVGAEGLALLTRLKIDDSQAAVARGDAVAALEDADDARSLEPWAASPYLQLALIEEQTGALRAAKDSIAKAIERDDEDWSLWLTQWRIEAKLGNAAAARRSLAHARALNPKSPFLASLE